MSGRPDLTLGLHERIEMAMIAWSCLHGELREIPQNVGLKSKGDGSTVLLLCPIASFGDSNSGKS